MKHILALILAMIMALISYQAEVTEESQTVVDVVPTAETSVLESVDVKDDARAIAALAMQYINDYRAAEGACVTIEMSGCTEYAEYRSAQIAQREKVEHNMEDIRAAAAALEYGEYVDPSIYGLNIEPYWQVNGSEAVGNGYGETVEEVARCLADGVYASKDHWRYVGSDSNPYMSIGVTYNNGYWYCCIIVAQVDIDTNPSGR